MKPIKPFWQTLSSQLFTKYKYFATSIFLFLLFCIHFYPFDFSTWHLIKYDDHRFIEPMLKIPLSDYYSKWFLNRENYAFPIRDLTFYFDQWISERFGFQTFWITNFILFTITLGAIWKIIRHYFSLNTAFFVINIIAFHPTTVEVIQWASIRKTILVGMFISIASVMTLSRYWDSSLKHSRPYYLTVVILWLLSLLCWPTAILWIFWFLWMERGKLLNSKKFATAVFVFTTSFVYFYNYYVTHGAKDYREGAQALLQLANLERSFYFTWKSLGRGFYNLILPYQLNPFYDDNSVLIYFGLLFFIFIAGYFCYRYFKLRRENFIQTQHSLTLFLLGLTLFTPQSFIFITFNEYVWADRYTYIGLPYFLVSFFLLTSDAWKQYRAFLFVPWIIPAIVTMINYVPKWRDDRLLLNHCAQTEKSPKCIVQSIQKNLNSGGCAAAFQTIVDGADRFKLNQSPYSVEFNIELPFYHAFCNATVISNIPGARMKSLEELMTFYRGAPDIVPAVVLLQLNENQTQMAWQSANQYYLRKSSISTTKNLLNIYRGQAKALCEILSTKECLEALQEFESSHKEIDLDMNQFSWGYNATMQSYLTRIVK